MTRRHIHTDNAIREIADKININDDIHRWYKVNWIIVETSHKICHTHGKIGHWRRQKIRHRLWHTAQQKYPVLRRYVIPREIAGDSPCVTKPVYTPSGGRRPIETYKKYYHRNIPALIAAMLIGFFIVFVPIIERKTIFENISHFFTQFNAGSLPNFTNLISVIMVLAIFSLFLLNGLGIKPNLYSRYAGFLSILYFLLLFLENVVLIEDINQVSISGISQISFWVATFGISIIGIIYLIFFEVIGRDKKSLGKLITFPIICAISLFFMGYFMPILVASTGSLIPEQFESRTYSPSDWYQNEVIGSNSKYSVGEIATTSNGQQGMAIISDDGMGHYTIVPVSLDNSQKGWHTNGRIDPKIVTYQSVEQQYPVRWAGGKMDISHIPDRDWTITPSSGSLSYNAITTPPTIRIPTTIQKTAVTSNPINEIVNRHNYYRSLISGANIPSLEWSSTLASSAQTWANYLGANNAFYHSGGQSENLAAGFSSWTAAIDGWGSEKSYFIYAPFGDSASNTGNWKDVGHYTQIIWKTTTQCGCGSASHPTYGTIYVCHYAPAGNIWGYYPY